MRQRRQFSYLQSLGIPLWVPRDYQPVPADDVGEPAAGVHEQIAEKSQTQPPPDTSQLDWTSLAEAVASCTACGLHSGRTNTVFGVGQQDADIMVIGEAPGADEDRQGEPFVGRAGKLLDEMLHAIKRPRDTVYIANIVKCRPPDNRNPQQEEALLCSVYLRRQIELVSPRVILAVGKVAAQNLLQTDLPIGKMRGNQYHYAALDTPVIVTYHPAYLLRSPKEKAKVWQDLKLLRSLLG